MRLSFIPVITALLPVVGVHISYLLSAANGHVPWCVPHIESCTSISATGRQGPEAYVFRAAIIPTAVFMMAYWTLTHAWLKSLGSPWRRLDRGILVLGILAALGLITYAVVLGSIGPEYRLQRRIGVTIFYACTVTAQLLLTWQIVVLAKRRPGLIAPGIVRTLVTLCVVVAAAGLISLLLWLDGEIYDSVNHAFEWSVTLLILGHLLTTHFAWRDSGFRADFAVPGR